MLELNHVSMTFNPGTVNEKKALTDINLHLNQGDFATIVGSNGAGKSTLFNAIAGALSPIPAPSRWTAPTSPSCRISAAPRPSAAFSRTR